MKNNSDTFKKDVCQTSINMLAEKTKAYLKSKFNIDHVWIPDQDRRYQIKTSADGCVDVVLFGGFLKSFISSGNWPDFKYRFWVVSNCVRDVLVKLLFIEVEHISVIPRYELFPIQKQLRPNTFAQARCSEAFDLVFSGRVSPTKNIEAVVWLSYFLQTQYNIKARLILIGDFDNMYSADRGMQEHLSYENQIKNLIQSLNWKVEPVLMAKLGAEEWLEQKFNSPILINLSTFVSEDFDVSLAQAQQQGWPSLITNWGGHRDQTTSNAEIIPWQFVGRSDESKEVIELKAEFLAKYLINQSDEVSKESNLINDLNCPLPVSKQELDTFRRKFLSKLGPEAYLNDKEGLAAFAETKSGSRFFADYRNIFGQQTIENKNVVAVLINDLNRTKNKLCNEINGNVTKIKQEILASGNTALLISIREALWPDNLVAILQSKTIYFSFFTQELTPVLKALLFAGEASIKIIIYIQKSCQPDIHKELVNLSCDEKRIILIETKG